MAERLKEQKRQTAVAKLNNCPTSPRKMRLVADLVRGMEINRALDVLKYTKKEAATRMYKLLSSAIDSWEKKNEGKRLEGANLCVKEIFVNQGRSLRRVRAAYKGIMHRIRKRSNHVTIVLGSKIDKTKEE